MIKTFVHKGLQQFFLKGSTAKINANHAAKLRLVLGKLNTSITINDMDFPGANLHPLHGGKKGRWAVSINANWRVEFSFENENAYDVDYL